MIGETPVCGECFIPKSNWPLFSGIVFFFFNHLARIPTTILC